MPKILSMEEPTEVTELEPTKRFLESLQGLFNGRDLAYDKETNLDKEITGQTVE